MWSTFSQSSSFSQHDMHFISGLRLFMELKGLNTNIETKAQSILPDESESRHGHQR